jgi:hypothetical protein
VKRQRLTYGPWVIFPLSIAAWGAIGILAATVLSLIGGGLS